MKARKLVFILLLGSRIAAWGIAEVGRWDTKVTAWQEEELHKVGLMGWYIPVGPTGIRAIITEEHPACFTVKYVFKNSPAHGKVKAGDLICGANGVKLKRAHKFGRKIQGFEGYDGPLMDMAPMIEDSQAGDGKLALLVHPGGDTKITREVPIQIEPIGRFSPTYPYNCPRSDKLVKMLCENIEKDLQRSGSHRPTHTKHHLLLALMASGEKKYDAIIKDFAAMAAEKDKVDILGTSKASWNCGYEGVFLGEYYLRTKDKSVLPRIKQIQAYYTDAIGLERGCYSHKSRPSIIRRVAEEGDYGYGCMGATGGLAMLAMSLFKLGGLPYDDFVYQRIHQAYLRSVTDTCVKGKYGFPTLQSVHIELKNPQQALSGRGPGFRCPKGMKDITDYTITGVGYWNWGRDKDKDMAREWWADTSWVDKERDRNIVVEWAGSDRHIIRDPLLPEPTKPYRTTEASALASVGLGALAHLIGNSDKQSWEYLGVHAANSCALGHREWFDGHASAGMHQLWVALGAARADEQKFREFMDGVKWWFIMMQTHDGWFMSCPNRDRSNTDAKYGAVSIPSANAAIILALARHKLQITGAGAGKGVVFSDKPSSSYIPHSISTDGKSVRESLEPGKTSRHLTAVQLAVLDGALLQALADLTENNELKQVPLKMSFTKASIWLKSASKGGDLMFQLVNGNKSAKVDWKNMSVGDRATLSMLIAKLKPSSKDAQAMAGVYAEHLGRLSLAAEYYGKADESSRKKLATLFDTDNRN